MACLGSILYDPATANTSKLTSALIAMTAIDTTNLRITFTVPASGRVLVRMACPVGGATTSPQLLFGVLEGSTVKGRSSVALAATNQTANTMVQASATFVVSGLTPAATPSWDAAYGVETVVASTALKYGGPNDTTIHNAWGGFAFEIWEA